MRKRVQALLGMAAVLMIAVSWSVVLAEKDEPAKKPEAKEAAKRPLRDLDLTLGKVAKAIEAGDTKTALAELKKARAAIGEWRKSGVMCAHCAAAKAASQKPVNTKCPIMGSTIDPDKVPANLRRTFKGQVVGFCCAGCPAMWDKLTDEQKAAKLKAALPAKGEHKPKAGGHKMPHHGGHH